MTEAEWLACADPPAMLDHLRKKASRRKLRSFIGHCPDPNATHVRGCWVVDLVLGKA